MIKAETRTLNTSILAESIIQALANLFHLIAGLPIRLLKVAYIWQGRAAQRRNMANLSDQQLADIGRTRDEIRKQYSKPFWVR